MKPDLERLLRDAAAAPREDLDLQRLEIAGRRRRRTRRGAGAIVILALVGAVAVVLPRTVEMPPLIDPGPSPDVDPTPTPDPTSEALESVAGMWRELPSAPVAGRQEAGAVWTGEEFIVWGGIPHAEGAAYDPSTDRWRALPPAPLDSRDGHVTVWTGSELLVWGGRAYELIEGRPDGFVYARDSGHHHRADGAAYDPATDTWRELPPAPLSPRSEAAAVWTGEEVIIVGGHGPGDEPGSGVTLTDGAAYSPTANTWRPIAEVPLDEPVSPAPFVADGAATVGGQVVVAWRQQDDFGVLVYDPGGDAWRHGTSTPGLSSAYVVASWGSQVVVQDYVSDALATYNPEDGRWQTLPRPPISHVREAAVVTADGNLLLAGPRATDEGPQSLAPFTAWLLRPDEDAWETLEGSPSEALRSRPAIAWTGHELLVWSGVKFPVGDEYAAHDDGFAWRFADPE